MNLKKEYAHKSISYQNRIKVLYLPLIDDVMIKDKKIQYNPSSVLTNECALSAESISEKVIDSPINIAKKIYNKLINNEIEYLSNYHHSTYNNNKETNALFLLMLLTAHRFGELLQLRKSDIYENEIISLSIITKTEKDYHFEYIESVKGKDDLLFPNLN